MARCPGAIASPYSQGDQKGGEIGDPLTVHYAPQHGSWLNQAEIELGLFSRQCLGTRRIPNLDQLQRETTAWKQRANQKRTTPPPLNAAAL